MERLEKHIPGFPLVPFLFPIGFLVTLLAVMAWLQYNILQELGALRKEV